MSLTDLLNEIERHHFPNPPATPTELSAFEARIGWRLDDELRAFYLRFNGACLFAPAPDWSYRLLPLSEIERARVAVFGGNGDRDERGPASWFVVCDNGDGDYVAIDVAAALDGRYPLFDVWHEGFPDPSECRQVAASFAEFLERALRSGGARYWLAG